MPALPMFCTEGAGIHVLCLRFPAGFEVDRLLDFFYVALWFLAFDGVELVIVTPANVDWFCHNFTL
jgi:hypothetical protein